MKIENLENLCTGCSACKNVCPQKCIDLKLNDEGFYYPIINSDLCIKCGKCDNICHCLNIKKIKTKKSAYYGWHKDDGKRFASSSGGAFIALADNVINDGGVVFGAVFDKETKSVVHACSDDVGLVKILKSKYVESNLIDSFAEVQNYINQGKKVLFCGAPCQISGLKRAVVDKNNLLLTCDFICHGVPSSKFFKEHLENIGKAKSDTVTDVSFRDKQDGWMGNNIKYRIKLKNSEYSRPYSFDSYYDGFMTKNIFLRKSCYNCEFSIDHYSDITIADFWGYRNFDPKLNDEKGISLIVSNNDVGDAAVNNLKEVFNLNPLDFKYAEYAYKRKDYSQYLKNRTEFYKLENKVGFEDAAKKTYMYDKGEFSYIKYNIKKQIKKILKRGI